MGHSCLTSVEFLLLKKKKFCGWMVVMAAKNVDVLSADKLYH